MSGVARKATEVVCRVELASLVTAKLSNTDPLIPNFHLASNRFPALQLGSRRYPLHNLDVYLPNNTTISQRHSPAATHVVLYGPLPQRSPAPTIMTPAKTDRP
jgi:hypothetical protein